LSSLKSGFERQQTCGFNVFVPRMVSQGQDKAIPCGTVLAI
jgi:hypothetical protein